MDKVWDGCTAVDVTVTRIIRLGALIYVGINISRQCMDEYTPPFIVIIFTVHRRMTNVTIQYMG
jgi:hypothetical protein